MVAVCFAGGFYFLQGGLQICVLGLCGIGCLIGWLLNYASGKGEKKHEKEK